MFGKRILIAVPHPDDEVVACCAAIGRAQAEGAEVFTLYLTHGCISENTRWFWDRKNHQKHVERRHTEAEEAARFLGVTPIGWSPRPARDLWRELTHVYDDLVAAINKYSIDQLWVPAYEGGNADHDGVNAVGQLLAHTRHRPSLSVLEFAEYNFAGERTQAQSFPSPNGMEQRMTLSIEERAKKVTALAIYASENNNLNYVGTDHECWRPLAQYDYSHPPHRGKLWYTRFQWVPFRHPRVDFTAPEQVSGTIVNFLKTQV